MNFSGYAFQQSLQAVKQNLKNQQIMQQFLMSQEVSYHTQYKCLIDNTFHKSIKFVCNNLLLLQMFGKKQEHQKSQIKKKYVKTNENLGGKPVRSKRIGSQSRPRIKIKDDDSDPSSVLRRLLMFTQVQILHR